MSNTEWELIGVYNSAHKAPELPGYIMVVEKSMIDAGYHEDIPVEVHQQASSRQVLALCVKGEKDDILRHLNGEIDIEDSDACGFGSGESSDHRWGDFRKSNDGW